MESGKRRHSYLVNHLPRRRTVVRLLLVDILPTLLLLLAMAFGMAYVAHKATDWPPVSERASNPAISIIIG